MMGRTFGRALAATFTLGLSEALPRGTKEGLGRGVGGLVSGGLTETAIAAEGDDVAAAAVPAVPETLSDESIESAQARAERLLKRRRAAALARAQTNFTSSLGAPRPGNTIKTALGGFS